MPDWIAASASRRGAHHVQTGRPNEDDARVDTDAWIVAVADGHGARQYTRADRGSRAATRAALAVLADDDTDAASLPGRLVDRWRELVDEDAEQDPPPDHELDADVPHELVGTSYPDRLPPFELYGTTLLAARDLGDRLRVVQIGDGDLVLARRGDDGEVEAHRPVPAPAYAVPGVTDSLVQEDAAEAVRVADVPYDEFTPELVLLATDGLDASRSGRAWHRDVVSALRTGLQDASRGQLDDVLDTWCAEAAEQGGDDTTIAVLVAASLLVPQGSPQDRRERP